MNKSIINQIPILTSLVVIIGIFKLNLFYNSFFISIYSFISLSEIAISVSENLIALSILYVVIILIYMSTRAFITMKKYSFNSDILIIAEGIIVISFSTEALIWSLYYSNSHWSSFGYSQLGLASIFSLRSSSYFRKKIPSNLMPIIYWTAISFIGISFVTAKDVDAIQQGKYTGTKISTKDTTYISTDSNYYIGQTEKYIIIYNRNSSCTIVPTSIVVEMNLHTNE